MRVDINLATQPYEDARRFWLRWGGGLVALGILTLLLLLMTVNGWIGARNDRRLIQKYEQQSAERDKEKADAQALLNLPQNSTTRDRSQFLNDLFQRKAFSWTKAFEDLERLASGTSQDSPFRQYQENETTRRVQKAIGSLHPNYKDLINLRSMEGLNIADTARRLSISVAAANLSKFCSITSRWAR